MRDSPYQCILFHCTACSILRVAFARQWDSRAYMLNCVLFGLRCNVACKISADSTECRETSGCAQPKNHEATVQHAERGDQSPQIDGQSLSSWDHKHVNGVPGMPCFRNTGLTTPTRNAIASQIGQPDRIKSNFTPRCRFGLHMR